MNADIIRSDQTLIIKTPNPYVLVLSIQKRCIDTSINAPLLRYNPVISSSNATSLLLKNALLTKADLLRAK